MMRPGAASRGYDSAWAKARRAFLAHNPRCCMCGARSTVVHHRVPHRLGQARTETEKAEARRIFWNRADWRPVCQPCHDGPCQQVERNGYHTSVGVDGKPSDPAHPFNQ